MFMENIIYKKGFKTADCRLSTACSKPLNVHVITKHQTKRLEGQRLDSASLRRSDYLASLLKLPLLISNAQSSSWPGKLFQSRVFLLSAGCSWSDLTLTLSCLVTMLGKCRDMPSRYKVVIIGRDKTQDIGI